MPVPGAPVPPQPGGPGIAHAATMLATPDFPPPGQAAAPAPSMEYAPTMLASDGPPGLMGLPGAPGTPGGPAPLGRSGPAVPPPPPPGELLGQGAGPAHGATGRGGPPAVPAAARAPRRYAGARGARTAAVRRSARAPRRHARTRHAR
ncbi:hypothetical protein ACFPZF_40485, partial [Kitasatospora cinereorecta]